MTGAADNGGLFIIERILRDREGVWRQISERHGLPVMLRQMLVSSVVSLACYGAVLGSSKGWQQALSSTVKLPVLFLATLAICLPTLYLFNLVFGARLLMSQAVSLIMVCITVTSVLTLAFAPISLFFRITAQNYQFFKLLNISILLLTAVVGLRFLIAGMRALNEHNATVALAQHTAVSAAAANGSAPAALAAGQPAASQAQPAGAETPAAATATLAAAGNGDGEAVTSGALTSATMAPPAPVTDPGYRLPVFPAPHPHVTRQLTPSTTDPTSQQQTSMTLLYVWILLFGFVGTQLAWTLRPFFGSPGEPFEIFRNIQGTFYGDVLRTIGDLLGG